MSLAEFADTLPFYVILVDEDHKIVAANRAFLDGMEGDTKEIIGNFCPRVVHNTDDPFPGCPLEESVAAGGAYLEKEHYDKDRQRWILSAIIPTSRKTPDGKRIFIRTARNISDQKKAEEDLRRSEANYREIFNAANDAIFIIDIGTGRIKDVNQKACEMFKYSRKELKGRHFEKLGEVKDPSDPDGIPVPLKRMSPKTPWLFEWRARDKQGGTIWAEVNLKHTIIGGKNRLLAMVRNVSDRKEMETQLLQSQKMEALGRLAGGIAHDFNNLLTAIVGYSDYLLMKVKPDYSIYDKIKSIRDTGERAS